MGHRDAKVTGECEGEEPIGHLGLVPDPAYGGTHRRVDPLRLGTWGEGGAAPLTTETAPPGPVHLAETMRDHIGDRAAGGAGGAFDAAGPAGTSHNRDMEASFMKAVARSLHDED